MTNNRLKVAFRNYKKRKGHTLINLLGLALAIASCILIGLYIQRELSFDTFHPDADRIYRVTQTSTTPEKEETSATTVPRLGPTLEAEYPRLVEKSVRLYDAFDDQFTFMLRSDAAANGIADSFLESDFYFADSTFFDVFGFELLQGNPETVLADPLSLVITPDLARKFFGEQDPVGQSITLETRSMNMTVTGVMKPLPDNSHIKANALASFNSLNHFYTNPENFFNDWFDNKIWTYVELKEGIQPEELSRLLPAFAEKYYSAQRSQEEEFELGLQPIEDIHLHSHLNYEMQPNGSAFYVYLFLTAALLLLVIACINYMNLATARATDRRREVGMRKALGASRPQLFWQFIGESLLLTFFAYLLAIGLVLLSLPVFNDYIGGQLAFDPITNTPLLFVLLGSFIVVGFLAGAYPAVYLSGFKPREIMNEDTARSGTALRKGLVVVQFALSVILIIGTVVVFLQLQHMQEKELGYDREQIVIMPISQNLIAWEFPEFKERAEEHSAIRSVTGMGKILGSDYVDSWRIAPAGKEGTQGETNHTIWVTYDFIDTFGLDVIAGRGFSEAFATDAEKGLLINEQMVQKLGYTNPQDALGELFYYTTYSGEKNPYQVVGVVKDFHYASIKQEVKPTVICLADNQQYRLGAIHYAAAKIEPGRTSEGLTHLEEVWSDINYIDPFNYSFQNEELERIYAFEAAASWTMSLFTILCIIVACMGLFGLASFTAAKRTKEIGIRKTMGASTTNILLLLNKQYIRLIIVANIIAWPVITYLVYWWLQNFTTRIDLGWNFVIVLLLTGLASLFICLATVSYQSLKAALLNPVESIRQE